MCEQWSILLLKSYNLQRLVKTLTSILKQKSLKVDIEITAITTTCLFPEHSKRKAGQHIQAEVLCSPGSFQCMQEACKKTQRN